MSRFLFLMTNRDLKKINYKMKFTDNAVRPNMNDNLNYYAKIYVELSFYLKVIDNLIPNCVNCTIIKGFDNFQHSVLVYVLQRFSFEYNFTLWLMYLLMQNFKGNYWMWLFIFIFIHCKLEKIINIRFLYQLILIIIT